MTNTPDPTPESQLGIEYDKYFTPAYIPILIRWEHEWLSNATKTYGSDAGEVWAQDILTRLQNSRLQQVDIEDLRLYCPHLLFELLGKKPETLNHNQLQSKLNALKLKK